MMALKSLILLSVVSMSVKGMTMECDNEKDKLSCQVFGTGLNVESIKYKNIVYEFTGAQLHHKSNMFVIVDEFITSYSSQSDTTHEKHLILEPRNSYFNFNSSLVDNIVDALLPDDISLPINSNTPWGHISDPSVNVICDDSVSCEIGQDGKYRIKPIGARVPLLYTAVYNRSPSFPVTFIIDGVMYVGEHNIAGEYAYIDFVVAPVTLKFSKFNSHNLEHAFISLSILSSMVFLNNYKYLPIPSGKHSIAAREYRSLYGTLTTLIAEMKRVPNLELLNGTLKTMSLFSRGVPTTVTLPKKSSDATSFRAVIDVILTDLYVAADSAKNQQKYPVLTSAVQNIRILFDLLWNYYVAVAPKTTPNVKSHFLKVYPDFMKLSYDNIERTGPVPEVETHFIQKRLREGKNKSEILSSPDTN